MKDEELLACLLLCVLLAVCVLWRVDSVGRHNAEKALCLLRPTMTDFQAKIASDVDCRRVR